MKLMFPTLFSTDVVPSYACMSEVFLCKNLYPQLMKKSQKLAALPSS